MAPFQGAGSLVGVSRGVAPGCRIFAPLGLPVLGGDVLKDTAARVPLFQGSGPFVGIVALGCRIFAPVGLPVRAEGAAVRNRR